MSGQGLTIKSPAMAEAYTYKWPLSQGRGNGNRGSEDKSDEATEIIETIKWVGEDHPEVAEIMGDLLDDYDGTSYESMKKIVDRYNKGLTELLNDAKSRSVMMKRLSRRPSRKMLKHILMQVYNKAISDPAELNRYKPFSPEVYGETSFELINQMIDQLTPITEDNKFIDLGSGVGQVVLQMAALTECKICIGIEKATIPAKRAEDMDKFFRRWMGWYGKKFSEYKIVQGDFFDLEYKKLVSDSSIVFVNNFAFGPEVDHMLKEEFADLKDGARIVSSKSFCPLNFRITERNLSDIGTIMHVSIMDKGSVSWTGNPVSYYLHVIDSTKLERYFNRQNGRPRRKGTGPQDESSNESRNSRASSVEKEGEIVEQLAASTVSSDDSDRDGVGGGRGRGRGRKLKRFRKKKSTPKPVKSLLRRLDLIHDAALSKITECEDSNKMPAGCVDETLSEKPSEGKTISDLHQEISTPTSRGSPGIEPVVGVGRPVRAAVANAAAIWEAQADDEKVTNRRMRGGSRARGSRTSGYSNVGDRAAVEQFKECEVMDPEHWDKLAVVKEPEKEPGGQANDVSDTKETSKNQENRPCKGGGWFCQVENCHNMNLAASVECFRCGTERHVQENGSHKTGQNRNRRKETHVVQAEADIKTTPEIAPVDDILDSNIPNGTLTSCQVISSERWVTDECIQYESTLAPVAAKVKSIPTIPQSASIAFSNFTSATSQAGKLEPNDTLNADPPLRKHSNKVCKSTDDSVNIFEFADEDMELSQDEKVMPSSTGDPDWKLPLPNSLPAVGTETDLSFTKLKSPKIAVITPRKLEKENSGEEPKKMWLIVKSTNELIEINVEKEKPASFDTKEDEIQWERETVRRIQSGELIPPEILQRLEEKGSLSPEEQEMWRKIKVLDEDKAKLQWLKIEQKLVDLDILIKTALRMENPDPQMCIYALEELNKLVVDPFMLKKQPEIVATIRRLRKYAGPQDYLDWSDKVLRDQMSQHIQVIILKADQIYKKFKSMFMDQEKRNFWKEFDIMVQEFKKKIDGVEENQILSMTKDPTTEPVD